MHPLQKINGWGSNTDEQRLVEVITKEGVQKLLSMRRQRRLDGAKTHDKTLEADLTVPLGIITLSGCFLHA
jgi:hypothetical protein